MAKKRTALKEPPTPKEPVKAPPKVKPIQVSKEKVILDKFAAVIADKFNTKRLAKGRHIPKIVDQCLQEFCKENNIK